MRLKISVLFWIIIFGLISCEREVSGKYYNVEDEKALHYIDFKGDGTFYHYYKKDTVERSHSGNWTLEDNKIHILNWEEYSYEYLKIISGMGEVKFGTTLGNQIFWIHGSRLDITPDGSNGADYIKEAEVEEIRAERKKEEEEREAYLKNKDTFYYPKTKIIKAIGKIERDEKNYGWKHFYPTGELESEGQYSTDRKIGIWKYYFKNGHLKEVGSYEEDSKISTWEQYFENGQLKNIGTYIYIYNLNDKEEKRGEWKTYDDNGKLIKVEKFPTQEKYYDSLYMAPPFNYNREKAIEKRNKRIKELDQDYNDYKASLKNKK
ncbi:lipocalin family protein [Flavobacterium sp. UW10123]|uniref:toxin-antitoxin system YwqK family antitoxin n=1 Tax=Flavobacterium sp. UW10123 TaxID=3230800 RepID=UPI003392C759